MKRSPFKRATPAPFKRVTPAPFERRDRSDEFESFVAPATAARMATRLDTVATVPAPPRIDGRPAQRTNNAIRDSARGEDCMVRIPGVCTFDAEKTIWSHAPFGAGGKARGLKAIDLAGAYCCTACDAAIDRQARLPAGVTREQAVIDWFMGHLRSLVRLKEKGLA